LDRQLESALQRNFISSPNHFTLLNQHDFIPFCDRKHQGWVKHLASLSPAMQERRIGDVVVLLSGEIESLVVDLDGEGNITVAHYCPHEDRVIEETFREIIFNCVRPAP
jgi:hypothetical protein